MEPFTRVESAVIPLLIPNIDTDQIIPARYVSSRTLDEFAYALFRNRRDEYPDFPLNQPEMAGRTIILAGHNFGCGSSREAAPWALRAAGFRAVISTAFGDIFLTNALKNGLLPLTVNQDEHAQLCNLLSEHPDTRLTIDLERELVTAADTDLALPIRIDPFYKDLLVSGLDELDYLLNQGDEISAYESGSMIRRTTRLRLLVDPS